MTTAELQLLIQMEEDQQYLLRAYAGERRFNTYQRFRNSYYENIQLCQLFWTIDAEQRAYAKRITKLYSGTLVDWLASHTDMNKNKSNYSISLPSVSETLPTDIPPQPKGGTGEIGLYMIGQTSFDPFLGEAHYFIKVGQTTQYHTRTSAYRTHNPCLIHIDFFPMNYTDDFRSLEQAYIHRLNEVSIFLNTSLSPEWHEVPQATYLELYCQGFSSDIFLAIQIQQLIDKQEKV